jgi:8-oxo-dGTP pyrophosphatase MutT (NUDIX family)
MKRVSLALIIGPENTVLMGQRKDNNLWSCPGGSCNPEEHPEEAVKREVKEETNLTVTKATLLEVKYKPEKDLLLFLYLCEATGDLDPSKDEDQEFSHLTYEDFFDRIYEFVVPPQDNVIFQFWAFKL